MTFDIDTHIWILFFYNFNTLVQFFPARGCQLSTARSKNYFTAIETCFFNYRTTAVLCNTRNVRTTIFLIIDTILVTIRYRTTFIPRDAGNGRAFVLFVVDAIAVAVRNRATVVFCGTRYRWAPVFIVTYIILISVRTAFELSKPCNGRA